eukprot:TRINITY_DN583_c0_g5_i1.p1 TRINITY_DN583_c0_g5~~TRINITY_DN583_c0_g5_i1.p1  ORF type:complete len:328 (-),score=139.00 TRINITY_DN583_c0_g5_i1:265-1248(-)
MVQFQCLSLFLFFSLLLNFNYCYKQQSQQLQQQSPPLYAVYNQVIGNGNFQNYFIKIDLSTGQMQTISSLGHSYFTYRNGGALDPKQNKFYWPEAQQDSSTIIWEININNGKVSNFSTSKQGIFGIEVDYTSNISNIYAFTSNFQNQISLLKINSIDGSISSIYNFTDQLAFAQQLPTTFDQKQKLLYYASENGIGCLNVSKSDVQFKIIDVDCKHSIELLAIDPKSSQIITLTSNGSISINNYLVNSSNGECQLLSNVYVDSFNYLLNQAYSTITSSATIFVEQTSTAKKEILTFDIWTGKTTISMAQNFNIEWVNTMEFDDFNSN